MDPRLKIKISHVNFIDLRGANLAIAPVGEYLTINMSLSYLDFSYDINVSIDVAEKDFVDLTPPFIRAASRSQINSLKGIIDLLKPYGFKLTELYGKLDQIALQYEQAALQFEN